MLHILGRVPYRGTPAATCWSHEYGMKYVAAVAASDMRVKDAARPNTC